ncbi:spore germination protein [Paenibacillus sp. GCM10027626]|uniref:spore germination protein n=1 Tax=Paenibacillus sp. GCM10027626 TaxID=3273411 RepID=UPI00363F54A1
MIRNIRKLLQKKQNNIRQNQEQPVAKPQQELYIDLDSNIETIRTIYTNCSDVVFRSFLIGERTKAVLIYIEGLSDAKVIDDHVLAPLMQAAPVELTDLHVLFERKISVSQAKQIASFAACIEYMSAGLPILLCEGENRGLALGLSQWEKRSIEEPSAEASIRGPREGFTETLQVNISQIRRIIKSPALKMESLKIGDYTQTKVAIAFIDGIADKSLVEEVRNRLGRIQIDGILESGYIEEMIEDNPYSPFPQLLSTERPDVACSGLLEGRVVILMEGTPFVLIAPTTFFSLIQAAEDYYQRFLVGTIIRWLRYIFLAASLLLPSFYVALLTFHQEMVPSSLLFSMASSREPVPFPALVEALLMEVAFEALREAGVRLPKQVGAAVSIVGALVIGQAAVQAGIVSAPMVMVVALTGIASFMIPRYIAGIAIRMLRFPMIFLAGSLGLLGIMMGIIAIVLHLCSLRSFGVPYLAPLDTQKIRDMKDVLLRAPHWSMDTRPHFTGDYNEYRQAPEQKPGPGRGTDT